MKRTDKMELDFDTYGLGQFALGNAVKYTAFVALALDMVAKVQQWNADKPRATKAETEARLSMALTLAKTPETTARRVLATVSGLALAFTRDHKTPLATVKDAAADNAEARASLSMPDNANGFAPYAAEYLATALRAEGVENLAFLETYARKGRAGVAALKAEFEVKAAEAAAKAAMTEAEATEAAKAEASPRAKAAKQAAAILGAIAKHGDYMESDELRAIASAVAEAVARKVQAANLVALERDKAEAARIAAEGKAEARAEARAEAEAKAEAKAAA